jgi:hypothetical protein
MASSVPPKWSQEPLHGVACASATRCVAVGNDASLDGVVVPITDGVAAAPRPVPGVAFEGVACPSATTCVATGSDRSNQGAVVTIIDGIPGAPQLVAGTAVFYSIACPDPTTCLAVGFGNSGAIHGVVVSVTNGTVGIAQTILGSISLSGVACGDAKSCEAVGGVNASNPAGISTQQGIVVPITNGTPGTAQAVPGSSGLVGVACPSADMCEAAGINYLANGQGNQAVVATIRNGTPSGAQVVAGQIGIFGVSCASTAVCELVGVDGAGAGLIVSIALGPKAFLRYPVDGQTDVNAANAFTWPRIPGAQGYILVIGTTVYGTDVFNSGVLAATASSADVPALPSGEALHATLLTETNAGWTGSSQVASSRVSATGEASSPTGTSGG